MKSLACLMTAAMLVVLGALLSIGPFLGEESATCVILKHTTPCGIAA